MLATIGAGGRPHQVPVCLVLIDDHLVVPVEEVKPKRSARLQRITNLERDPRASVLVEQWDPHDWSRLWWVRADVVDGDLDHHRRLAAEDALRSAYPQYRTASFADLVTLRIERLRGWAATAPG